MEKREVFGWLCLLIGITPALTFFLFSRVEYVAWFSNYTFIILGLALLYRSPFWAFAQLCLGLVPELVWSADFLWKAVTGNYLIGVTQYMFTATGFDWIHLYSLQHILFVPAAIYALFLLGGPVKQAWLGSIAQGIVMWGTSFALPRELNINCVYEACTFNLPAYQFTWPLLILVHIFAVYYFIMRSWKK